jgi:two-component system chemotaxis sensor kinase CheA
MELTELTDADRQEVVRTYLVESEEQFVEMEEALVHLETHPDDEDAIQRIFRAAHTLKGSSGTLGFHRVAEFAHAVEDLLDRLRSRALSVNSSLVTLLLRAVDALRQMVPDAVAGEKFSCATCWGILSNRPMVPHAAAGEESSCATCWGMLINGQMVPDAVPGVEGTPRAHVDLLKRLVDAVPTAADEEEATVRPAAEHTRKRPFGRRREDVQSWIDRTRTLRVDVEKLDRMLNLTGEIAIAQGRLGQMLGKGAGRTGEDVLEVHRAANALFVQLQEQIMKVRMVPVGPLFRQHIRTVRDMARSHGKVARLLIEGGDVEVDTTVIEHLRDPLMHMIRNAVDHGIEPPEKRAAAGKDPCGRVTLQAFQDAGSIVIQVADDGAGLNRKRIVEKALSRGLVADPERLADEEVCRLVFEPGFSTADVVTELSGRGVGLDVVRRNIEVLRGSVAIDSREGQGSTITIRLPLTLAIIEGFAVGVGGETYVMPLDAVDECVELPETERGRPDSHGVLNLRGEVLPYLRLRDLFCLGGAAPGRESVVDVLHGESQAVIKPLGVFFRGLPGISGSTILGDGRVALILDVPSLLREVVEQ